jgi:hypothetical protein
MRVHLHSPFILGIAILSFCLMISYDLFYKYKQKFIVHIYIFTYSPFMLFVNIIELFYYINCIGVTTK